MTALMTSHRRDNIGCEDFHRTLALSRRSFLQAGMMGMAGLSLSNLLRLEARAVAAGAATKRVNSVILLWMRGGPAQQETWDPKPDAPAEYRGEFGHIPTSVPGIIIDEFLPLSARIMHK